MELIALAVLGIAFLVQLTVATRKVKAEKKLPVETVTLCLLAVSAGMIILRRLGV